MMDVAINRQGSVVWREGWLAGCDWLPGWLWLAVTGYLAGCLTGCGWLPDWLWLAVVG